MVIWLEKATNEDAETIFSIQMEAFMPLLDKYKDFDTSPANETIERIISRINRSHGGLYKIVVDKNLVGAISVYWKEGAQFWISPMFIRPSEQGKGIAQQALCLIEEMFPVAHSWELATILQEDRNCYLYEKMGFSKTGVVKELNEKATLVFYKKVV